MSEEMQLELEHTLKTMRELKEAKAEIKRLRKMLWEVNEQCPEHVPTSLLTQIRATLAEEKA